MLMSGKCERALDTNKWVGNTPYLNFGEGLEVCPIYPFCGAQARLLVRNVKDHSKRASIYLDTHAVLGCVYQPYWEVMIGNTYRYSLDQTDFMVKFIRNELLAKPKFKKKKK